MVTVKSRAHHVMENACTELVQVIDSNDAQSVESMAGDWNEADQAQNSKKNPLEHNRVQ